MRNVTGSYGLTERVFMALEKNLDGLIDQCAARSAYVVGGADLGLCWC